MQKLEIKHELELKEVAQIALQKVAAHQENGAGVLALSGDLGAGKTAFTQALARELDIDNDITSPTFVIMKLYEAAQDAEKALPFLHLVHIDAYRIEDIDEMRVLRFEEILAQKGTIICIEWAEKIKELLPARTVYMDIEITGETSRTITFR